MPLFSPLDCAQKPVRLVPCQQQQEISIAHQGYLLISLSYSRCIFSSHKLFAKFCLVRVSK